MLKGVVMKEPLVGQKVVEIRPMTEEEENVEGWDNNSGSSMVIVFKDGTILYASRDPEGNGPGTLFGVDKDKQPFAI